MITKHVISRDDAVYHAWPDVILTPSGKLVCVFSECVHHRDRSYTRIMLTDSDDRGRSWSPKRPLTEGTADKPYFYNCARISRLRDGRLVVGVDKINHTTEGTLKENMTNLLFFSEDEGKTWSEPKPIPLLGIVPDKVLELDSGRWLVSAHHGGEDGFLTQYAYYSDDQGGHWTGPVTVAEEDGFKLCEASILPLDGKLVAFLRENSSLGLDCRKTISEDEGETWGPVTHFPIPGCHRPVAGRLRDGRVLITFRLHQGGNGWGMGAQNFCAALTDADSCLATERNQAGVRLIPIDHDRSTAADTGYSGWVQFDDGEVYVVNYIVDDAPKGQIRGYGIYVDEYEYDPQSMGV